MLWDSSVLDPEEVTHDPPLTTASFSDRYSHRGFVSMACPFPIVRSNFLLLPEAKK